MTTAFDTIDGCPAVYPAGRHAERLVLASRFPAALLTRPAATLYGWAAAAVRRRRLEARVPGTDAAAVVISIGNLEVGGNGKTPFAIEVIRQLRTRGHRPIYVSRGFGGVAVSLPLVTVRVPEAERPPVDGRGIRILGTSAGLAREVGDEGAMVASRCPDTPLVFGRDRVRATAVAARHLGASHVILDDAFQTWQAHRDLDVVLLDARHPFGNGRLVPAGTLREPAGALSRAGVVGANGIEDAGALNGFRDTVANAAGREVPVFGLKRSLVFVGGNGAKVPAPTAGFASLSSIARPAGFDRLLSRSGASPALSIRYPDHHRYGAGDVQDIARLVGERAPAGVITTEKDWAKLRDIDLPFDCAVARLELVVFGADGFDPFGIMEKPQG